MAKFKIGDIVKITEINPGDKIFGRYVGEEVIVYSIDEEDEFIRVRLEDNYTYFIRPEKITLVKERSIESICKVFNVDNDKLVEELKDYVTETYDISAF